MIIMYFPFILLFPYCSFQNSHLAVRYIIFIMRSFLIAVFLLLIDSTKGLKEKNFSIVKDYELPLNLTDMLKDIADGLSLKCYSVINYNYTNNKLSNAVGVQLQMLQISTVMFTVNSNETEDLYFKFLTNYLETFSEMTSIIFCETTCCEDALYQLSERNLIRRNLLYIFYFGKEVPSEIFFKMISEAMRIVIITYPKVGMYRIYYNQARPMKNKWMPLVNLWFGRFFKSPPLPLASEVYSDLHQRKFKVPVLHVPPWHFVEYKNNSEINVTGGRDHQLLTLLGKKLNFGFEYFDPPDHSQGAGVTANGLFKGVLGMIFRREVDFFLGDVTISWERQQGLEFSFPTLADSGAFVTHAPPRLNEASALLRPFHWEVWPAIIITVILAGPSLWLMAVGHNLWLKNHKNLPSISSCIWYTTSIFLKQCGHAPSQVLRARAVSLLLSLAATYVLGDMYSATLTSMLAKPARELPISTLTELENAMISQKYSLLVEKHSTSLSILQNGTGVYNRLWKMMESQKVFAVKSVEQGIRKVLEWPVNKVAFLAGRETLYFDTRRFGASNFHLSEKLYTRFSAIAFQVGCPYIQNFNKVLIHLFEAGILAKITSEEFEKLDKNDVDTESFSQNQQHVEKNVENTSQTQKLEPISMKMLQGAFYILLAGYFISGITLIVEIYTIRRSKCKKKKTFCNFTLNTGIKRAFVRLTKSLHNNMNNANSQIIKIPKRKNNIHFEVWCD